jgi:hypothetical protein
MNSTFRNGSMVCCALLLFNLASCEKSAREPIIADAPAPAVSEQESAAEIQRARTAIGTFAAALKSELVSAMQQGGPLNAIEVCNTRAVAIREQVSGDQGLLLSRVSLRNRNPDNSPLGWQQPVLESFNQNREAGANPDELDWSEIVVIDGRRQFRYMKAIPTGGLCLQCHGQNLAPDVSEVLSALYPEDKATGYSEGEIRGAFVVVRNL